MSEVAMQPAATREASAARSRRVTRVWHAVERWSFMSPAALLLLVVLAYPIFYSIEISFSEFDLATFAAGEWIGFENYEEVLTDYRFWSSLKITAVYLLFALPLQIVLGFGIAFLINAEWRGRGVVRALFIIPMVVAPVVAGGLWRMILDPLWGLLNYGFGRIGLGPFDWFGDATLAMASIVIIDTWRWTPFVVLIATAALLALPKDVLEAAKIDGANWWSTLWSVVLPLLVPIIAATFVIRWLGAVKMFDIVLASTGGGPGKATNVINLFIYEEAFRSLKFAVSAAMSIVVLVLTMVFTAIFLRASRKLENLY
jgi:multiple sugar transport system permease protein